MCIFSFCIYLINNSRKPFLDLQVLPWDGLWLGHPIYRRLCWTKWREGCVASSLLQMIVVTKVTEVNFNEELQKFSYKKAYWRPSYIWRNKCFLSVLWECSGCINHRPTVIKTIKCVRFQGRHYITHLFWVLFYWLFLKVLAKPDREPVEKLDKGDQADSKEESADPAKAGDEVQPGHPWRPLKLCKMFYNCKLWGKNMKQLRRSPTPFSSLADKHGFSRVWYYWGGRYFPKAKGFLIWLTAHQTLLTRQKRCSRLQYLFHKHCTACLPVKKSASHYMNRYWETSVSEVISSSSAILLGYFSLIGPDSWSI